MACVVPGCTSGYGPQSLLPDGVRIHCFPTNPEKRQAWAKAIPRANWEPSKRSRVCSLHFDKSDYITERNDSNSRRHRDPELKLARLKPEAIPRTFPGCPSYLSTEKPKQRPTSCQTEERWKRQVEQAEEAAKKFLDQDKVHSPEEILSAQLEFPPLWNIITIQKNAKIIFEEVILDKDDKPTFKFTLTVEASLKFLLVCNGVIVPSSMVDHITPNLKIERLTDVTNILAFLNSFADSSQQKYIGLEDCIEQLNSTIQNDQSLSVEVAQKLSFLVDQLQLALQPSKSRRYRANYLWTCIKWLKTSPALYKQILQDGLLTLPSISHLKRLSNAYSLETGLSDVTTAYLGERYKSLTDRQKVVSLIIDEVYIHSKLEMYYFT